METRLGIALELFITSTLITIFIFIADHRIMQKDPMLVPRQILWFSIALCLIEIAFGSAS